MPQQTVDLSVFQGMIGAADPKDIGGNNATVCENVNFGQKKGSLIGFNLDDVVLSGTSGTPLPTTLPLMAPLVTNGAGINADRYTFFIRQEAGSGQSLYQIRVFDKEALAIYQPNVGGYALYYHGLPATSAGSQVAAQDDAFIVSMGIQSYGSTNLVTATGAFAYPSSIFSGSTPDAVKDVAYEVLFIRHNQFQSPSVATPTSTLWQTGGGDPLYNKAGWANLNITPGTRPADDLDKLYFLPMEKVGKTSSMAGLEENALSLTWTSGDTINGTGYGLSDTNNSYDLEAGDYKYFYTAELMYTEETPPREIRIASNFGDVITTGNNHRYHLVTLKLYADNGSVAGLKPDPRVTAINVYRQYAPTGEGVTDIAPKVFIGRIPIEEVQEKSTALTWPGASTGITYNFDPRLGSASSNRIQTYLFDDVPSSATGPTYEDRTGLPDTFDEYYQYSGLNCQAGSYYFAGKSQITRFEDATSSGDDIIDSPVSTIFRSLSYRPRQLDWTTDFISVPFRLVGIAGYEGKVFAFGEGSMCVIDAETLSIDDRFDDIGLLHHHLITTTSTGLYWCDRRSIYKYDGRSIERIGAAIEHDADDPAEGWQSKVELFDPHTVVDGYSNNYGAYMGYDPMHNAIVIHLSTYFENTPPGYVEWAYFLDTGDWTRVTAQGDRAFIQAVKVGFTGSDIYFTKGGLASNSQPEYGKFYTVGTNASTSGFTWKSKELGFPGTEYGNRKAIYRVQVHGDCDQFDIIEDDSTPVTISLSAPSGGIQTGERSGNGNTYFFRQAKVKIFGGGNDVVDAISLRFRGLER